MILTHWRLIKADGTTTEYNSELPKEPGIDMLKNIICPLLDGADLEHVYVWCDYSGGNNYHSRDMFVDEIGKLKGLPINNEATAIYRCATMEGRTTIPPPDDPDVLDCICGPAVLFDRRVWY